MGISGNIRHRRRWQFRFTGQYRVCTPETPITQETEQITVVCGKPRRKLLFQLVNGADRLYALQPMDGDRPTKPPGIATYSVRLVVGYGRVQ